jgi:hypothetical protein
MVIPFVGFSEVVIRSVRVKGVGGMVNHQLVRLDDPRRAASLNVHSDGSMNVVDRDRNEAYDGNDPVRVLQEIYRLLQGGA